MFFGITGYGFLVATVVLSALLSVGNAWWIRKVKRQWQVIPAADREQVIPGILFKMRKFGAFLSFGQILLIFAAIPLLPKDHSPWAFYSVLAADMLIMIGSGIYSSIQEREIRGATASTSAYVKSAVFGLSLCVAGQLFIWGSFSGFGALENLLEKLLPWEPLFPAATSIAFYIFKIFAGFFALFACYPWLLRFALQLKRPENDELLGRIQSTLGRAGFRSAHIWYLPYDNMKHFNALVWKNPFFGQFSRPIIIVSKSLAQQLSGDELDAVLLHEISHLVLWHIPKRIFAFLLAIAGITAIQFGFNMTLGLLFPASFLWIFFIGLISVFLIPIMFVSRVVRIQEFQADAYSVYHFGAKPVAMKTALEKLYKLNYMLKNKRDPLSYLSAASAHPTLELRVESIDHVRARQAADAPMFQWKDYWRGDLSTRPISNGIRFVSAFTSIAVVVGIVMGSMPFGVSAEYFERKEAEYKLKRSQDPKSSGGPAFKKWMEVLSAKDLKAIETLAADPSSNKVLDDPIWGKYIFFAAADTSADVLDAFLAKVNVPTEFVEHSIPRYSDQHDCRILQRLLRYARERHIAVRRTASACN